MESGTNGWLLFLAVVVCVLVVGSCVVDGGCVVVDGSVVVGGCVVVAGCVLLMSLRKKKIKQRFIKCCSLLVNK